MDLQRSFRWRFLHALILLSIGPALVQAQQYYEAGIGLGPGVVSAIGVYSGTNAYGQPCPDEGEPAVNAYTVDQTISPFYIGTIDFPLIKKNGTWQAQSVTTPQSSVDGSILTLTLTSGGTVTAVYSQNYYSANQISIANAVETLDLNTGYLSSTVTGLGTGIIDGITYCTETSTLTQSGVISVSLEPVAGGTGSQFAFSILNPAAANGGPLPLPSNIPSAAVPLSHGAVALAADGASAAALVVQSSSADPVTFTLSASGFTTGIGGIAAYSPDYLVNPQPGSAAQYTAEEPINEDACTANTGSSTQNPPCIFLALLYAPATMPNNNSPGSLPTPLTLSIQAVQTAQGGTQDGSATNSILLMPPPLVLVHGLWSSAEVWQPFESWIETNYPHQFVFPADYGPTSSLSFTYPGTQQVLTSTIGSALATAAQSGFVAQKIDVLAHSMGGLVTRYLKDYGAPPPYASNFLPANPVHDLVTVGTPHDGSALAQVLDMNPNVTPAAGSVVIPAICAAKQLFGAACTLSAVFAIEGNQVGTGTQSLEPNSTALQSLTDTYDYQAIVGGAPVAPSGQAYGSVTEGILDTLIGSFYPGETVDTLLGNANDLIVSNTSQLGIPVSYATASNVVHINLANDTAETASPTVWNQVVYWLLGIGNGQAPVSGYSRIVGGNSLRPVTFADNTTSSPFPVLELTGYTQVSASNVSFSPATGTSLTIGTTTTIAATSSTKTISEILLYQTVADPADVPVSYATQSPFTISFTPIRLGSANFTAFAVFTDNTFAVVPLSYTLQPSGSALGLSLSAPTANLQIGLNVVVPAQAFFANGPVNVTQQATYSAQSGGTAVFSVGANGSITTNGNGVDWLDASYGGQTASALITVGSCTYALSPKNQIVDVSGGTATIQVTTTSGCAWTANASNYPWLSLTTSSGIGSGAIIVTVTPNTTGGTQTGFITVANQDVAVIQPGTSCSYVLGQTQINAPAAGASGSISVSTACPIVTSSSANWVTVTPLSSSVAYYIAPNTGNSPQSATVTIGDQMVSVSEAGATQLTTPTVTVAPSLLSLTTVQSLSVMVTVAGAIGSPTPTGTVTLSSGAFTSSAVTLSSGSATISIPAGSLSVGSDTLTVNYTPDSSSSSIYNAASGAASSPVSVALAMPAVTVTPGSSSITTTQALSVTVTVSGGSGAPTPTGSVTLTNGSYISAAATLSGGSATINIPAGSLSTGSDTLAASYTPDSNSTSTYNTATGTSSAVTVTQAKTTPTVTVTPSASSITTAQALTATITINGGSGNPTPTGTVTLTSGSYTSGATNLSSGSATINIPAGSLAVGSDTLTASYTPDSNSSSTYNTAAGTSSAVTVTQAKTTPTVTVTPSASSITTAQALSVTVVVSGGSGNPTPTGSVTLTNGSYSSSATILSSGSATINVPAGSLAVGSDTLTASYTPDSNSSSIYNTATGTSSAVTVTEAKTTPTVAVTLSSSGITTAQALTVTVAVSGGSGNPTPTGSVTLSGGGYTSAATTLSSGSATINISAGSLAVGSDTLTASYTPNSNSSSTYNTAAGTSASVTVTQAKMTPTVTVTPSASSITTAQGLTVTVAVSGGSGNPTPTGTVTLTSGSYTSAATNLSSGSATINIPAGSLGVGSDTLTATYSGDSNYSGEANTASVTVNQAQGFTLSASPATLTVAQGGSWTSTITVTDIGGFSGNISLSASGLPNGVTASFAAGSAAGAQVLTLTASTSAAITSNPVTVTITGTSGTLTAATTITLTITAQPGFTGGSGGTTSITITPGATTGNTGTISVAGTNGFSGTVSLSCSITPTAVSDPPTCSFSPSSVQISGTTSQASTLTVNTTAQTNAASRSERLSWPSAGGTGLALVLLFGFPRRRNWLAMLGLLILIVSVGASACGGGGSGGGGAGGAGGGGNSGTTPGTYTITVTGASGTISATVGTVTLTVQ